MQSDDDLLVRESAERLYGGGHRIWDPKDRWNAYKRSIIDEFSEQHARALNRLVSNSIEEISCPAGKAIRARCQSIQEVGESCQTKYGDGPPETAFNRRAKYDQENCGQRYSAERKSVWNVAEDYVHNP